MVKTLAEKIVFSLANSLVDRKGQSEVPVFIRPSPVSMQRVIDNDARIKVVPAHYAAFSPEDGSFLIEPAATNLVTWNMSPANSIWVRGSNVSVSPRKAIAPDGTPRADIVSWSLGNGVSQIITRKFLLTAGKTFNCKLLLRLVNGSFKAPDVARFTTGVTGAPSISLQRLTNFFNQYAMIEFPFVVDGATPLLPSGSSDYYPIVEISGANLTLGSIGGVLTNGLVGAQISFTDVLKTYTVQSNTASNAGTVKLTLSESSLAADGVTTNSKVRLLASPKQECTFEMYSESAAAIHWGGIQIEQTQSQFPFGTSMIYQDSDLEPRAGTIFFYRRSPIRGLTNFGVFIDLSDWAGDGNICDFGNFKIAIAQKKLVATAGSTQAVTPNELPKSCKIYVQAATDRSGLFIYVDGVLVARTRMSPFTADVTAQFDLKSEGVRLIRHLMVTSTLVQDEQNIDVTMKAGREVKQLFIDPSLANPSLVISDTPTIKLQKTRIPGRSKPVTATITQVTSGNTPSITIDNQETANAIQIGTAINVFNGKTFVTKSIVTAKNNRTIYLQSIRNIVVGQTVTQGERKAGLASVRFPFEPIDQQKIIQHSKADKSVTVASILGFSRGRAIIQNSAYQDVGEVLVRDIYPSTNTIIIDDASLINNGYIISQPRSETIIDPSVYLVTFTVPIEGVRVLVKAQNGVLLENTNDEAVFAEPLIQVFM